MFLQLGKAYYVLEAKAMATEDLLSAPSSSWDCDCNGDPPPFFHLPPPPAPPGLFESLDVGGGGQHDPSSVLEDDCDTPAVPWTCPALKLDGGVHPFGSYEGGTSAPELSPEVPVAVIIVCATMLSLFFVVAAIILVNRAWRSYKASSKKTNCDLDSGELYEDLPAAPPLLAPPHLPVHAGHPPLRYKEGSIMLPPPRGGLPPTPALHLYSPEPRPDTPSDHLYHHISSAGSETCSCSTSEAPSNALIPNSLQLIPSEDDERSSSSSHSYSSSSTATPTSSSSPPAPVTSHPLSLYLCPSNMPQGHNNTIALLQSYGSLQPSQLQHQHRHHLGGSILTSVNGGVCGTPSSIAAVYSVGAHPVSSLANTPQQAVCAASGGPKNCPSQDSNMVPLAQIYSPNSHLYEAATLMRGSPHLPNNNNMSTAPSMVHWGNVPATMLKVVHSQPTCKPLTPYDSSSASNTSNSNHFTNHHPHHNHHHQNLPGHHTLVHPTHYLHHNGNVTSSSTQKKNKNHKTVDPHHHHHHNHQQQQPLMQQQFILPQQQVAQMHPYSPGANNIPLPLHSSTLLSSKLAKSMYDVTRSPDDLTPTNSIPINSLYNTNPGHMDGGSTNNHHHHLIATTCLSTIPSLSNNQNEYSTTIDALNLNQAPPSHYHNPEDSMQHHAGVSDTSTSSHPSTGGGTDGLTVTESSSLDSSGTSSSTIPLTAPLSNQRKDLPPLPSRVDRYRIYAAQAGGGGGGSNDSSFRSHTTKRPSNNNYNNDGGKAIMNTRSKNFKSFDDLHSINDVGSTADDQRVAVIEDVNNVANNNYDCVSPSDSGSSMYAAPQGVAPPHHDRRPNGREETGRRTNGASSVSSSSNASSQQYPSRGGASAENNNGSPVYRKGSSGYPSSGSMLGAQNGFRHPAEGHVDRSAHREDDEEDDLYDKCNDT